MLLSAALIAFIILGLFLSMLGSRPKALDEEDLSYPATPPEKELPQLAVESELVGVE